MVRECSSDGDGERVGQLVGLVERAGQAALGFFAPR
jgi:hypothetical protein